VAGIPEFYDAGKGLLRWWLDRDRRAIKVHHIKDPQDKNLEPALRLCERMLPSNEVDSPSQVARWLAEVKQETAEGRCRLIDYLLVSTVDDQVCGVLYAQYYPLYKLMFVSYVVADEEIARARDGRATQSLFKYLQAAQSNELAEMEGVVFEMEYPRSNGAGQSARTQSPYRQPRLDLEDPSYEEERQLLAYGRTQPPPIVRSIPREEAENVLSFVYNAIYGDQFEGYPNQDREYRQYLTRLCTDVCDKLSAEVPVVSVSSRRGI
jgi:hypothetical protein